MQTEQAVRQVVERRCDIASPSIRKALDYVENFTKQTIKTQPKDDGEKSLIGLGDRRFRVPNTERFPLLFYWDSYFMMQSNLTTPEDREIAKSTIDAFGFLLDKHGIIPNASVEAFLVSSQPPLLSSMVMETYEAMPDKDTQEAKQWLVQAMSIAEKEYTLVWANPNDANEGIGAYHHYDSATGLSHYGDRDYGSHHNAERESGWDFTLRFANRANDYLPIDLNCFLYTYEVNFAKTAEIVGDFETAHHWMEVANRRKQKVNELMWSDEKGFFFDYDTKANKKDDFYSLAAFSALWSGLATPEQATRILTNIEKFDRGYGLLVDAEESIQQTITSEDLIRIGVNRRNIDAILTQLKPKQWDFPYVFPPIEYMAIKGMLRYARDNSIRKEDRLVFYNTAIKILEESIYTTTKIFEEDGTFPEKYNGVTGSTGTISVDANSSTNTMFHYKKQGGFGWTCATYKAKIEELSMAYQERDALNS